MKRKLKNVFVILVTVIVLIGCGLTVKQRQLSTIDTFNMAYKQYLDLYDKQTPEIQKEWKDNIDEYWRTASKAIDAYFAFSNPNSDEAQKKLIIYETSFKTAKDLLLKYGVTIKEN